MLSALLMFRRFAYAMRYALREEDFGSLSAALALNIVGTLVYTLGAGWSAVDGFYVAVATLTTSSIGDPKLTITDPWLKILTAFYVLVGIGILVEVARRLGMGFIAAREEIREAKAAKTKHGSAPPG
jgi:Ion channel